MAAGSLSVSSIALGCHTGAPVARPDAVSPGTPPRRGPPNRPAALLGIRATLPTTTRPAVGHPRDHGAPLDASGSPARHAAHPALDRSRRRLERTASLARVRGLVRGHDRPVPGQPVDGRHPGAERHGRPRCRLAHRGGARVDSHALRRERRRRHGVDDDRRRQHDRAGDRSRLQGDRWRDRRAAERRPGDCRRNGRTGVRLSPRPVHDAAPVGPVRARREGRDGDRCHPGQRD